MSGIHLQTNGTTAREPLRERCRHRLLRQNVEIGLCQRVVVRFNYSADYVSVYNYTSKKIIDGIPVDNLYSQQVCE